MSTQRLRSRYRYDGTYGIDRTISLGVIRGVLDILAIRPLLSLIFICKIDVLLGNRKSELRKLCDVSNSIK